MAETIVRGGTVVTSSGVHVADIRIGDERIVEVGPGLSGSGDTIDARGLLVMPGVVDVHVHFNEPGRTEWEGGRSGSHALAAGGGTTFVDMPLNSTPCVLTARDCDRKREALEASSVADFGLWGGLVPGRVDEMPAMVDRGVIGFKAFMCDSGLPEFPRADDDTLRAGMEMATRLGVPIAVHAEDEATVREATALVSGHDASAFLRCRPLAAELAAIARALELAEATGAAMSGAASSAAARPRPSCSQGLRVPLRMYQANRPMETARASRVKIQATPALLRKPNEAPLLII